MGASSTTTSPDLQPIQLAAPDVPGSDRWRVHVYAHTHWDREWYRTFERFRMQLVGMVDRLLNVLDGDPRFHVFVLDGQTIVLEDYLALRPEEEPRIRRLVGAGRLEVGPWHVLPDEFLVSGESLVRNLLEGRRVASRFGHPLSVGYLPDPFGHVAQLPAILRGFGIDNVIFSRGMHDEFERTGSEFRWEGADGTDVLAIVQTSPVTTGYCNAETLARGAGPDDAEPYDAVRALVPVLAERARADMLLLAAGCDHETAPALLPDILERVATMLPDADVRIAGLGAAVDAVRDAERRLEEAGRPLARLRGELRGSLHAPILSSIFSARVPLKQANDELQVLLERHLEPLVATAVLAGVRPARDVEPFLRHAWRLVLENHPHDSIGGCSIDDVHDEMPARSLRARAVCHGLVEDLRIALELGGIAVVHDGEGLGGIARRGDGTPVAVRPGMPGQLLPLADQMATDEPEVTASEIRVGDRAARVVEADGDAWLEVDGGSGPIRVELVDDADAGDEYDFGALPGDVPRIARLASWDAASAGPGVAELRLAYELDLPVALDEGRAARATQLVRHEVEVRALISSTSPLVQLVVEFDNAAADHRLRLRATNARLRDGRVEALGHFALVDRPARPAPPLAAWRQDPPGLDHCLGAVRLVDDAGADVLLAGRGMHEYEVRELEEGVQALELTLLRCVGWLSRNDVPGRPGHAGPGLATPGAQCIGPHRLELAVGSVARDGEEPHAGRLAALDAARGFLAPPLVFEQLGSEAVTESGARARTRDIRLVTPEDPVARIEALGLRIGGEGVVPSTAKLADDGSGDLVVRWWAPVGSAGGRARLELAAPVRSVLRARLDETTLGPATCTDGVVDVAVKPGAIVTLRVALER